jgi:hypothetical protein
MGSNPVGLGRGQIGATHVVVLRRVGMRATLPDASALTVVQHHTLIRAGCQGQAAAGFSGWRES